MGENLDVTIEMPGQPPIHTTTEGIKCAADKLNGNAMHNTREQLRSIVERVERLDEERKTISDDIRDMLIRLTHTNAETR